MIALADLGIWAAAIVCLGLAFIITVLVIGLFKWLIDLLNAVPAINIGTGWLHTTEQTITNALGTAFAWVNHQFGTSLHAMANLLEWGWREFRGHATLLAEIAGTLAGFGGAIAAIRALVNRFSHTGTHQGSQIKTLERELHGIERQIKHLEHDLSKGIGDDVLPRLKKIDRELGRIEHHTIPAIEAADTQAATAISNLWRWVHDNVVPVGTTAFAGAVAVALSTLGLGALRCPGFLKLLSKRGCGLGGLLDGLLGLVISALALENTCALLPVLEAAFGDVVGPVIHLLTEVPLGDCERPPQAWAQLSVAAGPLPPRQTLGALPV